MRVMGRLLFFFSFCFGAFDRQPLLPLQIAGGTVFQSLGTTGNFFSDPASLLKVGGVASVITSKPFRIVSLSDRSFMVSYPSAYGNLGFSAQTSGLSIYRETTVAVAAARKFGESLNAGLRLSVHQIDIKNYGAQTVLSLSGSLFYPLSETVSWSLLGFNLNGPRLGQSQEPLPQILATGYKYSPAGPLKALIEIEKDLAHRPRQKFGVVWETTSWLSLATGYANNPDQASFGFSLQLSRITIDYAIASHLHLPETHTLAVHFRLP